LYISKITVFLLFSLVVSIIIFIERKRITSLFIILTSIILLQMNHVFWMKSTSEKEILMMVKEEVLLQDGFNYYSNYDNGARLFSNYSLANKLEFSTPPLRDVFAFQSVFYLKVNVQVHQNLIQENNILLVGKDVKINPRDIVNDKTLGVIYSGYENSSLRMRWQYYCDKNQLKFYDVNETLFVNQP